MKNLFGLTRMSWFAMPLALSLLSGCAAIEAQNLAGQGNRLVEKGELDQAYSKYTESVSKADNGPAQAGMAEVLMRQGKYADAEEHAKQAIELTSGAIDVSTIRYPLVLAKAQLLQGHGGDAFEAANSVIQRLSHSMSDPMKKPIVKEALLLQVRIIEATSKPSDAAKRTSDPFVQSNWPDDLDFRAEDAIIAALEQDYAKGKQLAESVLKLNAEQGNAKLALGMALAADGKVDEAKAMLGPVLREDHTRAMVFLNATRHIRRKGNNKEAITLLQMLAEVQPKNHLIHNDLAVLYRDLGMIQESIDEHLATLENYHSIQPYVLAKTIDDFKKALADTPPGDIDRGNMLGYYESLSYLYSTQNNVDRSLWALQRAAAIKPSRAAYQNMAVIFDKKGDSEAALAAMEAALELDPGNAEVLKALGSLAFKAKQCDRARGYLESAANEDANDFDAHLNLGVVLFNCEEFADALKEFSTAVELQGNNVEALFYKGVAQLKAEDKDGALATLKKVVELEPDHSDAYRELGNIALERKQYKLAEKYYALEDKYKGKK